MRNAVVNYVDMSNDELVELLKRDKNPSLALQLAAVRSNPQNISFIEKQLPEACLAAVKQNKLALDYVKDTKMRKWVISQLE